MKRALSSLSLVCLLASSATALDTLPSFKFKNDFRLRFENQKMESTESRSRYRFRLRLSTDSKLSEDIAKPK